MSLRPSTRLLASARASIDAIATLDENPDWDNFVVPLADAVDPLGRAWGQVGHLNAVVNTPALRDAHNDNLPKITEFHTDFGQNERLFARYRALGSGSTYAALDKAQRQLVDNTLRDFRLSGAELPPDKKARLKVVDEELATLSSRYEDNVLDATNAWKLYVEDAATLAGVPADVLAAARQEAAADGKPGWKLSLRMPCYLPVMEYADQRPLRETLYRAFATRASEFGNPEWDNSKIIGRVLELRREAAGLLGYASYAEVSLVPKMARSPAEVLGFLRDLAAKARPFAERDMTELRQFARDELGLARTRSLGSAVCVGEIARSAIQLLGPGGEAIFPRGSGPGRNVPRGRDHFRCRHPRIEGGGLAPQRALLRRRRPLRGNRRPVLPRSVCADGQAGRRMDGRSHRTPPARCDRPAPRRIPDLQFLGTDRGKSALFTHDEVTTLFHEFGHGLHLLLTRIDVPGVSGLDGVEWDAVELPSQFMENFCWEWDVLKHMTSHVDTCAPLPRVLFDRMIAAKNFQSGMQTVRQIEFALFDMHLHHDFRRHGEHAAGAGGRGPAGSCRSPAPTRRSQPYALLQPHFCRRLRCWLLQLQVGRGAIGGRVQPVRGAGGPLPDRRCAFPGRSAGPGREPAGNGVVHRFPRQGSPNRRPLEA